MSRKKKKDEKKSTPPTTKQTQEISKGFSAFFLVAVGICGGSIMVLEILGTRVLAPVFGMSLYIWTALLVVTMTSLAIGYSFGGRTADRIEDKMRFFFATVAAAGTWLVVLAAVKDSVLLQFADMGPRSGPLLASFLLFSVPLTLLAMAGPLVTKLLTREMNRLGVTVGKVSAISTIGSLIGTVATGYFLIPELGIWKTLWCLALLLLIVAAIGFTLIRSHKAALAGVAAIALAFPVYSFESPTPQNRQLIFSSNTPYCDIRVVDSSYRKVPDAPYNIRFLFLGHGMHTVQFRRPGEQKPVIPPLAQRHAQYWDTLRLVPLMREQISNCLLIGLGGGVIIDSLKEMGITDIDVVEIDQQVVEVAQKYFACEIAAEKLLVMDARQYIKKCQKKYDLIIMDAFGAGTAPAHLFSVEAFSEYKALLSEDGILFSNYIGFIKGQHTAALSSIRLTIDEVFAHTIATSVQPDDNNFVFLSATKELVPLANKYPALDAEDKYFLSLLLATHAQLLQKDAPTVSLKNIHSFLDISSLISTAKVKPITDALNPLEALNVEQNDHIRRVILRNFGDVFLVGWENTQQ